MFYSFDFWCLWGPTSHGDSPWHSVQFSMIFLSLIQAYDHVFFSILWPSHNIWTFPFLDLWNIHISNQIFLIVFFIWYLKAYLCLLKRVKGFKGVTDYCIQLTQNDDYFFFIRLKVNFNLMRHFTIKTVQCVVHFLMKCYSQSRSLSIWHEKMGVQEAIFVDELSGRDQMGQKPFYKILI